MKTNFEILFILRDKSGKPYLYKYMPDKKDGILSEINGANKYSPWDTNNWPPKRITMDEALKLGNGQLFKINKKRLHEIEAEVRDAVDKMSDDSHGGDSVAHQEKRNGKEEGKSSEPKDKSGRKDAQNYQKVQKAMMKEVASYSFNKKKKERREKKYYRDSYKRYLDEHPDAKLQLVNKQHKSSATSVGSGGDVEVDDREVMICVETLAQLWGLKGLPTIEEEKMNPLKYEILRATNRNPLPAVYDPWRMSTGPKILITNDESGSCAAFSGATKKIAQALAKFAKDINVDIYYASNGNGEIIDENKDQSIDQQRIYDKFDYVLYIGDGDGIGHLMQHKISPKSTWIYMDTYAHNSGSPKAEWMPVNNGRVMYVYRVNVGLIDSIAEGLVEAFHKLT